VKHLTAACFSFLLFVWVWCFVPPVFAARSVTITSDKSSVLGEEEITLIASPSGFTDGETIYLKGAFFQNGSSNYFGYTENGDVWIKNSASNTSQRSVTIGQWDGSIVIKSDFSDSGYKGEGDYIVKLGFYYGSYASVNWSANILPITINEPDPTPTVTPTPVNTPTPTATPKPTATPTILATPTIIATKIPTPTAVQVPTSFSIATGSGEVSTESALVLGNTIDAKPVVPPTNPFTIRPLIITLLFIGTGLGVLSLVFIWQKRDARKLL